jgi:MFS family permease
MIFYYLHDFGLRTSLGNPGLFFTVSMVTMILVRLFGMPVFDRVRKNVVCAWTLLMLAAGYGILPWSHVTGFVLPGILIGFGWGVTFPLVAAVLFDLSQPEHRAVNTNLGLVTIQGGFLLGPLMGNVLINTAGYRAMFLFCAVLSLAAALLAVTVPMTARRELS